MTAVSFARGADKIIDVGCDHGYLSSYMVMHEGASFAYACDINEGPLTNAMETVRHFGIEEKVTAVLSDGLDKISENMGDTVFICGMGGELIAQILSASPWTAKGNHKLILQPMTKIEYLRTFLYRNGYHIEAERIIKEDFRFYSVMLVVGGAGECGQDNMFMFSNNMIRDSMFYEYIKHTALRLKKVANERINAGYDADVELAMIKILEENNAC